MIRRLLLALIRFYRRFLSPMHAPCCPFTPTCSTYAMQAIERHGAIYPEELEALQRDYAALWEPLSDLLKQLSALVEL